MKKPILTLLLILTTLPLHAAEKPAWKEAVAAIDAGNLAPMQTLADAGDAAAQHSLGVLYEKGEGVPADAATAAAWYHKAAAQGYASAQYNLALMYRDGRGVARDAAQAQHWYEQTAAPPTTSATTTATGWASSRTTSRRDNGTKKLRHKTTPTRKKPCRHGEKPV